MERMNKSAVDYVALILQCSSERIRDILKPKSERSKFYTQYQIDQVKTLYQDALAAPNVGTREEDLGFDILRARNKFIRALKKKKLQVGTILIKLHFDRRKSAYILRSQLDKISFENYMTFRDYVFNNYGIDILEIYGYSEEFLKERCAPSKKRSLRSIADDFGITTSQLDNVKKSYYKGRLEYSNIKNRYEVIDYLLKHNRMETYEEHHNRKVKDMLAKKGKENE